MVSAVQVERQIREANIVVSGSLLCLVVVGQPLIIIDDPKVASDLLDKRSAIYSSRMPSRLVDLCDINFGRRGIKH